MGIEIHSHLWVNVLSPDEMFQKGWAMSTNLSTNTTVFWLHKEIMYYLNFQGWNKNMIS